MANPFDAVTKSLNLTSASQQLQSLNAINENLLAESLKAMQSSQASNSSSGGGIGSALGAIGGALEGGLGLSSLISSVADLFGGGGSSAPSAPTPYMQPLPIHLDAGFNSGGSGLFATDSADGNVARAMTNSGGGSGSAASSQAANITVQVQAMDSQSFLNRSQDIALAVRQAMLETTVLNDVVRQV